MLKVKFMLRTVEQKCLFLSPIVQALREPVLSKVNYCFISCGTGLGILSLEKIINIGILKTEILKFTEFGELQDIAHIKDYLTPSDPY
ncbi:hypothetical protein C1645_838293 [Glomus cerebriforme]|uniref:Uncharacterized protein n=1 Tax=Glomus cerebriforme TaxID=658196 RepID=A0A397SE38_9GLOM|nr:hypothetical protein C1645_838293 [Glomus cerebriforme]